MTNKVAASGFSSAQSILEDAQFEVILMKVVGGACILIATDGRTQITVNEASLAGQPHANSSVGIGSPRAPMTATPSLPWWVN